MIPPNTFFRPQIFVSASSAADTAHADDAKTKKIKDVARQFESALLTSLLGPLQKSFSSLPGKNDDPGSGEYESMETQALASGMAAGGGLGIANMLVRNLLSTKAETENLTAKVSA